MEYFIIQVENAKTYKVHRLAVIITYKSSQVIRFTIKGKDNRYVKAEKLLFRKRHSWKLGERNFIPDPREKTKDTRTMQNIIEAIEIHLKGPLGKRVNPKNDFDIR